MLIDKGILEKLRNNDLLLTKLNLSWNKIGDEETKALGVELAHNTALTKLNLSSNGIGDEGAKALGEGLAYNNVLTKLNLSSNRIGNEGAKALEEWLAHNTVLTKLDLFNNKIGDEETKILGAGLAQNNALTKLDLFNNKIGDEETKILGAGLAQNNALTKLNLSWNKIGDEGAKTLGERLAQNNALTKLDLSNNKIGDEGAKALGAGLAQNNALTKLNLSWNKIGDEGAKTLGERLAQNNALTKLDLFNNEIGDEGAKALGVGLAQNNVLTKLNLFNNKIGDEGAEALGKRLVQISAFAMHSAPKDEAEIILGEDLEENIFQQLEPVTVINNNLNIKNNLISLPSTEFNLCAELYRDKLKFEIFSYCQILSSAIISEELIGSGGYGQVFKGRWCNKVVAIKRFHLAKLSEKTLKQISKEAKIISHAQCDYVVKFFGINIDKEPYSLIMEYVDNGDLYHYIHSSNPLNFRLYIQIAKDIANGLSFLHYKGILHRDLKPHNVLLNKNMQAKLSDFGLSKMKKETRNTTTVSSSSGGMKGTFSYMAPELWVEDEEGCIKFTEKSDIYSYSMILWELYSRQKPFSRINNPQAIPLLVSQGKREEIPADCHPKIAELIKFCWSNKSLERPTANEILKSLDEASGIIFEDTTTNKTPNIHQVINKDDTSVDYSDSYNSYRPTKQRRV